MSISLLLTQFLLFLTGAYSPDVKSAMCITIDDLPLSTGAQTTENYQQINTRLIAAFRQRQVPAVGFVNERKLYQGGRPDTARVGVLAAWLDAGLELGNHTFSHPDYHRMELEQFKKDILRGEQVTRKLMEDRGMSLRYFRHPFLHAGETPEKKSALEAFLREKKYTVAPVTIDNADYIFAQAYENALAGGRQAMADSVARTYLDYMEAKAVYYEGQSRGLFGRVIPQVLLVHANRLNAEHLGTLLDRFSKRGYRFATLDETLRDPAYRSPEGYSGPAGISWIHRWAMTEGVDKKFFKGEPATPLFIQDLAGIKE